jgi:hypothetical protein
LFIHPELECFDLFQQLVEGAFETTTISSHQLLTQLVACCFLRQTLSKQVLHCGFFMVQFMLMAPLIW